MGRETEFFSLFRRAIISRRREGGQVRHLIDGESAEKRPERWRDIVPVRNGRSTSLTR